jgi:hypothetical protein
MRKQVKEARPTGRGSWLMTAFLGGIVPFLMTGNFLERMFVYSPTRKLVANPASVGLEYLDIEAGTRDGIKLHGWFLPAPGARNTFLVFHGNSANISYRVHWLKILHGLGAHVMIIDYRGYGRSQGHPSEQGLYLDAQAAFDWWTKERASDRSRLILVGESLGGAVAVDLAARVPVDGIVLQSTFTTAWDLAKTILPFGLLQPLSGVRFDSLAKIRKIQCPKLFIHGERDDLVPLRLGRKLFQAAPPPKRFYEVQGAGHNDLLRIAGSEYEIQMRSFLSQLNPQ